MALQVHISWMDPRLALILNINNTTINSTISTTNLHHLDIDQSQLQKIWRPSIYFSNANTFTPELLSDKSSGQMMGKIMTNGIVHIVKRFEHIINKNKIK